MSKKYDEYLAEHISNVEKGYEWLCEHSDDIHKKMKEYEYIIKSHDASKYLDIEYNPYDRYFYGNNKSYKVVQDFKYAWLNHIHHNPHHWQYWILQNDDEPEEVLEIPYHYVIEMICDWWSFSWKTGKLDEIFSWYQQHKDMKLHERTRKLVEDILDWMKKKFEEDNEK